MTLIWSKNGVSYLCLGEYLIQNEKYNKAEYVHHRVHSINVEVVFYFKVVCLFKVVLLFFDFLSFKVVLIFR